MPADEFIFGDREAAIRFAKSQGWKEAGRVAWITPNGNCVHFIKFDEQLEAVKRGERVYLLGKPEARILRRLKKLEAEIATVELDQISVSATPPRRFPAPWKVEKIPGGFIVKDANGQSLAYVYADNRQVVNTHALTEDEARRIASNIAKLPGLLVPKEG